MISLGARLVNAAVRLMTLRARRRHMSLSRSVKFKEKPYSPPRGYAYSVRKFNGTDERNCLLSPAYADLKGLPPMLILCGAAETSASDSDMLYDGAVRGKVRARLIKYGGMFHDFFYLVPFIRESRAAWRETERFLAEILSPQCGA